MFEQLKQQAEEQQMLLLRKVQAADFLQQHWETLQMIAELTERQPDWLPEGLVIYGQSMPKMRFRPEAEGSSPQPGRQPIIVRKRQKGKHSHRGALRLLMETVRDVVMAGQASTGKDAGWTSKDYVYAQIDQRILPPQVFSSAVVDACRGYFLEQNEDRTQLRITDNGWSRIDEYDKLPRTRTKISTPREYDLSRADSLGERDAIIQAAAIEVDQILAAKTEVEAEANLFPLTDDAILQLLPASRLEMLTVLDSLSYDVTDLKDRIRDLSARHLMHKEAGGMWQRGPAASAAEDSLPVRLLRPDDPGISDPDVAVITRAEVDIVIGLPEDRMMSQKDLERKLKMPHDAFAKAAGTLRGKRIITDAGNARMKLTDRGRKIRVQLIAREAEMAVRKS